MAYKIRIRIEDGSWKDRVLPEGEYMVGRSSECGLVFAQNSVSFRHACLALTKGEIKVMDLGSVNGTQVDGVPVHPRQWVPVGKGQILSFGLVFLVVDATDAPTTIVPHAEAPVAGQTGSEFIPKPEIRGEESAVLFRLRVRKGEEAWQERTFRQPSIHIGRSKKNDVDIDDPLASRLHAIVEASGGQLWLIDQNSTNGTKVDGKRIAAGERISLAGGNEIRIGAYSLRASLVTEEQPALTIAVPVKAAIDAGKSANVETRSVTDHPAGQEVITRPFNFSTRDRASIGRAADNNVVLPHPLVSRYHAVIERVGGRFYLTDLSSANGVYVNDTRVERNTWLREGDQVRIGPYAFILSGANLEAQTEQGLCIQADHVEKWVTRKINLLQDISLTIRPQEFGAFVGMSGAGKSTLLDALSGFRPATHGKVTINGIDVYKHFDLFRNDIGYVPQKDIVHPELTPRMALDYAAQLRMPPDLSAAEREALVSDVLTTLGLANRANTPIARLSGGQVKRVSIGVELLTKPRLFFLDEPTSGLDPGTEYEMMKLLRKLADQGRTVMLVTHATKNVMLCDKVVFMAPGGYLAFYGPPDEALTFFDAYRTERERREKEMEFDDIYRILSDESRGSSVEWDARFRKHQESAEKREPEAKPAPSALEKPVAKKGISAWRQFRILSARNLNILLRDRISLLLMLLLAPGLGLLDFVWGTSSYDPVKGDAIRTMSIWFMLAIEAILVGSLGSVREIVKEADIYKRERTVGLQIVPYILSKVWVGAVLAVYQGGMLLLFRMLLVRPALLDQSAVFSMFITVVLGTLSGYMLGLAISAIAPNQNASMLLLIAAIVPQFLFAGVLLSLDFIPGGEIISRVIPTRWTFEAFVNATGVGDVLVGDACWNLEKDARADLTDAEKAKCPCMGKNIFTQCAGFPGILSEDFYDQTSKTALNSAEPLEPTKPETLPSPTPFPSPTPANTSTPVAMTYGESMDDYLKRREAQGKDYQSTQQDGFDKYQKTAQKQGDDYADTLKNRNEDYADALQTYGDDRAKWERDRQKPISSAESLLQRIYDNYGRAFPGTAASRWLALGEIIGGLFVIILVAQRRKDVV